MVEQIYFGLVLFGILVGVVGEKWRARWAIEAWRSRKKSREARGLHIVPTGPAPLTDAAEQLRVVSAATFEKRPLLSKQEYKFFRTAETTIEAARCGWRVMAQVCLGEILASKNQRAFSAINSKRVDFLIVCQRGLPVAAIEYQGNGHYQGTAAARDAVKKEALRRAGVRYIEVTPEHAIEDLTREIQRVIKVERLKQAS